MSQEDGMHGLEKKPDSKDAMSKLNKLISLRFDENIAGNDTDAISLRSVVEEAIASPGKEITENSVSAVDINKDVRSSEINVVTTIRQEQRSSVVSEQQDPGQEWQHKLNELASTSFAEVSYESYELKLEEPKPPKEPDVLPTASRPLPHADTITNSIVHAPVVQSVITQKLNTVLEKKDAITASTLPEKKELAALIPNRKQKEASFPDPGKQTQILDKDVKESIRNMGKKPVKTEDTVSIIDVLDSIESEMKKKEAHKSEHSHLAGVKKDLSQHQPGTNTQPSSFDVHVHKTPKGDTGMPVKVAVLYSEAHNAHSPKNTNIEILERPERLTRAMVYLERCGVFGERCDLIKDKYFASEKDLLQVHSQEYVKFVRSYSASGGGFLGDSTYMTSSTFEVAGLAAGSAIQAGELVVSGKYSAAMVIVRPPGHHAGVDKYRGFCIFNNVAVLARYLQKKKGISKVMIIDWDAHAGDGTMEIFYNDPTVMVVSLHRDPHDFYPRRGFSSQIGEGPGKGYTANVEMPVGAGDEEYAFAFDEFVIPILHSFSPDFVICSCGFDAYYKEQHMKLNLTSAGYHLMAKKIMSVMNGNFVLVMEGGYHKFNGHLAHVVINSLLGLPDPVADTVKTTEYERNQQRSVMKETEKKIGYIKEMLGIQGR
ncbi:histone deacetylase [Methanomethylovorans sp.]|uniref:histone deacetylase family protein n=1 Tax=Methanomethylovorans sp. TaxID=2758717 RepID=UPI00351CB771